MNWDDKESKLDEKTEINFFEKGLPLYKNIKID